MRVLGIDPGLKNMGWCLLIDGCPADGGTISLSRKENRCLERMTNWMIGLVHYTKADEVAVEEVVWQGRKGMLPLAIWREQSSGRPLL